MGRVYCRLGCNEQEGENLFTCLLPFRYWRRSYYQCGLQHGESHARALTLLLQTVEFVSRCFSFSLDCRGAGSYLLCLRTKAA
jgi:hypothetical protein